MHVFEGRHGHLMVPAEKVVLVGLLHRTRCHGPHSLIELLFGSGCDTRMLESRDKGHLLVRISLRSHGAAPIDGLHRRHKLQAGHRHPGCDANVD
jgi:hypothetical protein